MPKLARTRSTRGQPTPSARHSPPMARVWDPFVRVFHWSLVTSFAVAWFSPQTTPATLHYWAGYAAASLIMLRLIWGFLGTPHARFSSFVRHPRTVIRYVQDILKGREARYIGHNPAGGAMVLALMAMMVGTSLTGWMMTTDRYFGVAWVETVHELASHALLVLILAHLGGVALASYRHRENLVRAMVSGRKRVEDGHGVNRA